MSSRLPAMAVRRLARSCRKSGAEADESPAFVWGDGSACDTWPVNRVANRYRRNIVPIPARRRRIRRSTLWTARSETKGIVAQDSGRAQEGLHDALAAGQDVD